MDWEHYESHETRYALTGSFIPLVDFSLHLRSDLKFVG